MSYHLFSLGRCPRARQSTAVLRPLKAASSRHAFRPEFLAAGCFHEYFLKTSQKMKRSFNYCIVFFGKAILESQNTTLH